MALSGLKSLISLKIQALSEKQVIHIIMFRQDVITWHSNFHIDTDLYYFRIPTAEDAEERREGNPGVRYSESHSPPRLHHFNHQKNVVSTGNIDVKSENMIGNIT